MAEAIRLWLLGRFRLQVGDAVVTLPTRKIESLLSYLALHPAAHTRDRLAGLFWGDYSDRQARASLRNALALLRKVVASDLLVADRNKVQINLSRLAWIDAVRFGEWVDVCGYDEGVKAADWEGVELYGGELLADFYDDWIVGEREHYHRLYLKLLLLLSQRARVAGEYQTLIKLAQKLVECEPLLEQGYQLLMLGYVMVGDRLRALREYERCKRQLQAGLGVEPSAETVMLHEWIKRGMDESPGRQNAKPTNLPAPLTSFIGREWEVEEVKTLTATRRLVTLVGPGGCGKTRFAIEVGTRLVPEYADGVWWADLSGVVSEAGVAQSIAKAMGLGEGAGEIGSSMFELMVEQLHSKSALLVVDNCEHLIEVSAQLLEALLSRCPQLHVLATSRENLGMVGEVVWVVSSLAVPHTSQVGQAQQPEGMRDLVSRYEGTRLFIERAASAKPGFAATEQNSAAIAEICYRLDGLPLAIELAAVYVNSMPIQEIANRLGERLALPTRGSRGGLSRHQTLQAAMDWSYNLLSEAEQTLFRRISVFVGGFTGAMPVEICGEEVEEAATIGLLTNLVNKSLVIAEELDGKGRYRLLETIRQYGLEKLTGSGEEGAVRDKHRDWMLRLAESAQPHLRDRDQIEWLDRLDAEGGNLSAALQWTIKQKDVMKGVTFGAALWRYWERRGSIAEGSEQLGSVLALAGKLEHEQHELNEYELDRGLPELAEALLGAGVLAHRQADYGSAIDLIEKSLSISRKQVDHQGIAQALYYLGWAAHGQSRFVKARVLYESSLLVFKRINDKQGVAEALTNLGMLAYFQGDYRVAEKYLERSLETRQSVPEQWGLAFTLWNMASVMGAQGRFEEAASLYKRSLTIVTDLGDGATTAFVLEGLACLSAEQGMWSQAGKLFGAAEQLRLSTGYRLPPWWGRYCEQIAGKARVTLGESAYHEALDSGRAMASNQAIAYAFSI